MLFAPLDSMANGAATARRGMGRVVDAVADVVALTARRPLNRSP
ncbi:hypothetical protein [Acidovorax soli]|nr:hypothetical protein [Acidovorax soli]